MNWYKLIVKYDMFMEQLQYDPDYGDTSYTKLPRYIFIKKEEKDDK